MAKLNDDIFSNDTIKNYGKQKTVTAPQKTDIRKNMPKVKGTVIKDSLFKQVLKSLIPTNGESVRDYIIYEVLIPTAKNTIMNTVGMLLYNKAGNWSGVHQSNGGVRVYNNYDSYSRNTQPNYPQYGQQQQRQTYGTYQYNEIAFSTRGDAEAVLMNLTECIDTYGNTKVSDLYEFAGVEGTSTDYNYGWYDLSTARVMGTQHGWKIDLPKAVPLNAIKR